MSWPVRLAGGDEREEAYRGAQEGPAMDKLHHEHAGWVESREQLFAAAYPG